MLEKVKSVLVYKDDDELDTGMQKVQPLPYLGQWIGSLELYSSFKSRKSLYERAKFRTITNCSK